MQFCFGERSVYVNFATSDALQQEVMDRFKARAGFSLATINLDHLVKLSASDSYLSTYLSQDLVVADGRPIVWLSKLAGCPVELMPGSDMVEPLCRWAATAGVSVAFVGSTQAALADAERVLAARVPGLNVAWTHAPGRLDPESAEVSEILDELAARNIGLCFLALGAPKQERIAQRGRERAPHVGFASVGAGLDFFGGHQRRAPLWVRRLALEWLWRALSSPLRLGPRYLKCIAILPRLVVDAYKLRRDPNSYTPKAPARGPAGD